MKIWLNIGIISVFFLEIINFNYADSTSSSNSKTTPKRDLMESTPINGLTVGGSILASSMNSSQGTDCVYSSALTIDGALHCSCWRSHSNDANPWLQVGFIELVYFYKTIMYCSEYSFRVKAYKVATSLNGVDWTDFNGGSESSTTSYCESYGNELSFSPPVLGRAIRIYPTSWNDYFEMRLSVLFYDLSDDELLTYLNTGEEIAALLTGARFFASNAYAANSLYGYYITKTTAPTEETDYNGNGFWVAGQNNFIQIGIHNPKEWVRIETKGSQDINSYVVTYQLKYSYNGVDFYDYNSGEIINANSDNINLASYSLSPTVIAKALRIYPLTWIPNSNTSPFALRVEAYYINTQITTTNEEMGAVCSAGYLYTGGVEKEIYRDNHFFGFVENNKNAFSSAWIQYLEPTGSSYIQLGMVYPKLWTKIQTKGREPDADCSDCEMYVSKYSIYYSNNGLSWNCLSDANFDGNENTSQIKENVFSQKFVARSIRVATEECASAGCALQLELFYEDELTIPEVLFESYYPEKLALSSGGYFFRSSFAETNQFDHKINLNNNCIYTTGTETEPWVMISMARIVTFTGFSSRLQNSISDGTFTAKYSLDGITWNDVDSGVSFQGSIEKHIPKRVSFTSPVVGRGLKLFPQNSVAGYFSFQVEVYYEEILNNEIYTNYAGGEIDAFQTGAGIITSSYYYESDLSLKYKMGYLMDYPDNPVQGFRFEDEDQNKYFQFGVPELKKWTKIDIQGAEGQGCWINTLTIKYSIDGSNWSFFLNEIEANTDETTIVTITFDSPVLARVLRIITISWNSCPAFKIRAYYSEPSLEELYAQNIDTEIRAVEVGTPVEMSSSYSDAYAVGYPINQVHGIAQCWRPLSDIEGEWIQLSTTSKKLWTALKYQGRHPDDYYCTDNCEEYVNSFKIEFSLDGKIFKEYRMGEAIETEFATQFSDVDTIETVLFDPQIKATSIRVLPLTYQTHMSMRIDAIFKEVCDWRCDDCTISNDNTKCTSCKSFFGIEGILNDDGETYTCQCNSLSAVDSQFESCGEVYESAFDLSAENPTYNLGSSGTFVLVESTDSAYNYLEFVGLSSSFHLVVSPYDIGLTENGVLFAFQAFSDLSSPTGSIFYYMVEDQVNGLSISEGLFNIRVSHVSNGLSIHTPFDFPENKWFLLLISLKNNDDGSSLKVDLKIEGDNSWMDTYEVTWENDDLIFFDDPEVFFGYYFEGYMKTLEIVSFNGEIPYSRDHFHHTNSSCQIDSLCLGLSDIKCTRCPDSFILVDQGNSSIGYCIDGECPSGFFFDSSTQTCRLCPENCAICIGGQDSQCQECQNSFFLNVVLSTDTEGNCITSSICTKTTYEYESLDKCGPVVVTIIGSQSFNRLDKNILTSELSPSASPTSYLWSLASDQELDLSEVTLTKSSLIIPAGLLECETYIFCLTTTFSTGYSSTGTFELTTFDYVTIIIEGDLEREYNIGDEFSLDASGSFSSYSSIELSFEWSCYRDEESTIPCVLYDQVSEFEISTGAIISFDGHHFQEGTFYFWLKVSYEESQQRKCITVTFTNIVPEPLGILTQYDGCYISSEELIFKMISTSEYSSSSLIYFWDISKDGDAQYITQGLTHDTKFLRIAPNILETDSTYAIHCKVQTPTGYGEDTQTFTTCPSVDNSSGVLTVTPIIGEALLTIFTVEVSGIIDNDGGNLHYIFRCKFEDEDSYSIFQDLTELTSVSTRFGSGSRRTRMLEILVEAINSNGQSIFLSENITLIEPFVEFPLEFITQLLSTLADDQKLMFMEAAALTLIRTSDDLTNQQEDECGGCNQINNRGVCNTTTKICQCNSGYQASKNCRYSDYEADEAQSVITFLLTETITQYNTLPSESKGNTLDTLNKISRNQDLISIDQNQQIQTILEEFAEDTSILTEHNVDLALQIMANFMVGVDYIFQINTDQEQLSQLRAKSFQLIQINSIFLHKKALFLLKGQSFDADFSYSSKLFLQKSFTHNIEESKIGCELDECPSIEFSEGFTIESEEGPISSSMTSFKNPPLPLTEAEKKSILLNLGATENQTQNSTTELLSSTVVELFQESDSLSSSDLSEPLKVKFEIGTRRRLDIEERFTCLQFDSGQNEYSENGMELGEIGETYLYCIATIINPQGLYTIARSALEMTFDSVTDNIETLTNFNVLKNYNFSSSPIFYFCNLLVLIMIAAIIISEKYERKKNINKIVPESESSKKQNQNQFLNEPKTNTTNTARDPMQKSPKSKSQSHSSSEKSSDLDQSIPKQISHRLIEEHKIPEQSNLIDEGSSQRNFQPNSQLNQMYSKLEVEAISNMNVDAIESLINDPPDEQIQLPSNNSSTSCQKSSQTNLQNQTKKPTIQNIKVHSQFYQNEDCNLNSSKNNSIKEESKKSIDLPQYQISHNNSDSSKENKSKRKKLKKLKKMKKKKGTAKFIWKIYSGTHSLISAFLDDDKTLTRTKKIMLYFFEVFLVMLVTGLFFDFTESDEETSFIVQAFLAIVALGLTIPFKTVLGKIMQIENSSTESKFQQQSNRVRTIIGIIIFILMILMCIIWINMLSAKFEYDLSVGWLTTFLMAIFTDYLLVQNIKCGVAICIIVFLGSKAEEEFSLCEVMLSLILEGLVLASILNS